jgi:hypothetical protein
MDLFQHSHEHGLGLTIIKSIAASTNECNTACASALDIHFEELAAIVLREGPYLVRSASDQERRVAKTLLRRVVQRIFPDFTAPPRLRLGQFSLPRLTALRAAAPYRLQVWLPFQLASSVTNQYHGWTI